MFKINHSNLFFQFLFYLFSPLEESELPSVLDDDEPPCDID
mgnify:CR=1 FL=1